LSEIKIESLQDTCKAAKKLHELGSKNIVITSLNLPLRDIPLDIQIESSNDESLYCFTSQVQSNGDIVQHLISFPTYTGYFTGTGDLFASLVVARVQEAIEQQSKSTWSLINAVYRVVCSVNHIAKMTFQHQKRILKDTDSPAEISRTCELRLIQGKKAIEAPENFVSKDIIKSIQI
jgi:pyridoxine kinase